MKLQIDFTEMKKHTKQWKSAVFVRWQIVKICLVLIVAVSASAFGMDSVFAQQTERAKISRQSSGDEEIAEIRRLLDSLGYWVELNVTGTDASLRHALIAFQKIEGRKTTGAPTPEELQALRLAKRPAVQETGYAHIEVDLERQVLFIVECGGVPLRILPISSGSGELFTEGGVTRRAITPTGRFKVQWKINGWRKSPLGLLYYPSYIYGGIAIHGNPLVPTTPASHGCIRIPMFAAKQFSEMAVIGMDVIVYDNSSLLP